MIVFVGIAFALTVLAIIIGLLLRRRLREKYAILWLVIGVVILVLALFPGLLIGMSDLLGVQVPSNLIFALALVLLVGVALHLSWELSLAEDEVRRVAEEVAILHAEVDDLKRAVEQSAPIRGGVNARHGHGPSADADAADTPAPKDDRAQ